MRALRLLSIVTLLQLACAAPALFHQNLGPAHKVRPGMSPDQVRAILGAPFANVVLQDVEEWRYCDSRSYTDDFVVVYFHDTVVIDKASYTILNPAPNAADQRVADCRATQDRLYSDHRSPPRRVQELRQPHVR
jgi:hypothetical protein